MRFATGWMAYRRPKAENPKWRKVVENGVRNLELRTEVAKMGETIVDEWIRQGEERGIERGIERGRYLDRQDIFLEVWTKKFGTPPDAVAVRIRSISDLGTLAVLLDRVIFSTTPDISLDIDPTT